MKKSLLPLSFSMLIIALSVLIATFSNHPMASQVIAQEVAVAEEVVLDPASPTASVWECWGISGSVPCNRRLNDVHMLSSSEGWAVGENTIVRWDGTGWQDFMQPNGTLRAIDMTSASNGWAVGDNGLMMRWDGTTWAYGEGITVNHLNGVSLVSTTDGWAVGNDGVILRWNGSEWNLVSSPTSNHLYAVAMLSATDGWAVGIGGIILRWDGGAWSQAVSPTTEGLYSIDIVSANRAYVVGNSGTALRWNGSVWESVSGLSTRGVSVHMLSTTDGWAIGNATSTSSIYRWNGSSWAQVYTSSSGSFRAIHMVSASEGWVVGSSGKILRWNGSSWVETDGWPHGGISRQWNGVDMLSVNDGWAVGGQSEWGGWSPTISGIVRRWNGAGWSPVDSPTSSPLRAVSMFSTINGWAVGDGGTILKWNGQSWTVVPSGVNKQLNDVKTISATDVWAVGGNLSFNNDGIIIHWNGSEWSVVDIPITSSLSGIDMVSATDGWAVGESGRILHWDGTVWSQVSSPTTNLLYSVHMVSANDGWAVGGNGTILRWNGTVWSQVSSPTTEWLHSVHMVSANDGWAISSNGTILRWNGSVWSQASAPPISSGGNTLYGIAMISSSEGWAVGSSNFMRYSGGSDVAFGSISGQIKDSGNTPLAGVVVTSDSGHSATTDANGDYTITGLIDGTYTITPSKEDYAFSPISRAVSLPPDATGQDFTATQTAFSISGQISDGANSPIPGVTVSTNTGRSATTNANGEYSINSLPAGTYTINPNKTNYTFSPTSRTVAVPPDAAGRNFVGVFIPPHCSQANMNRQPLLLVTGWGGSRPSASQDEQLSFFFGSNGHLAPYGYVEGCNLFYAQATSPYLWLSQNGELIRNNLCMASNTVSAINPNWNGRFDIIAYSYGGLRARAYLENSKLYGQDCPGTQRRVYVDNLFTMGTPHGGEPYPLPTSLLPFAGVIGLCAVANVPGFCEGGGGQWQALVEMQPAIRAVQNLSSSQPAGVCYHLLSGDARQQRNQFPRKLIALTALFPSTYLTANDLAVHESSAVILNSFPYSRKYSRVIPIYTHDLHGHATAEQIGPHNLRSFVYPADTFTSSILPHLGSGNCSTSSQSLLAANDEPTVMGLLAQQTEAQVVPGLPLVDIAAGSLSNNESVSGNFTLTGDGPSQVMLSWTAGDVSLSLLDPNGVLIDATTAAANPNVDYLSLDTGFSLMATYLITDTVNGVWQYTIAGNQVAPAAAYRLVVLPPTPIAVSPSLPQWAPNNASVIITATVSYSATTPLIGGQVEAQIRRPGGSVDILTLYDDGNHHDGQANDGVFGGVYTHTGDGGVYGLLFTATGDYASEAYTRTATAYLTVAPAGAALSGTYSDRGVDDTGNGVYDWLEVTAQIAVTEAATYTISADLYAGETFIAHARTQTFLEVGQGSIAVLFDGAIIFAQRLDGPYAIRNVILLEESPLTLLIEAVDNAHSTQAYRYGDFGAITLYLPIILR